MNFPSNIEVKHTSWFAVFLLPECSDKLRAVQELAFHENNHENNKEAELAVKSHFFVSWDRT